MTTNITSLPVPSFAGGFVTDDALGDPESLLLYAEASVGKSTLAGQLIKTPGFDRGLYIDVENGSKVFNNDPDIKRAIKEKRLSVLKIDKTAPDAFARIHSVTQEIFAQPFGYDFVVLDSLDIAQGVAVDYYKANTYNESGKLDTRAAYAEVGKWTSDLAWGFQNSPHFMGVLVGHSTNDEDKKTGQSSVKPKLAGSMKDNISSIPDLVIYMWKEKDEDGNIIRVVSTEGDGDYIAKSRFSTLLPSRLENPTMPEIFAYIRGEKKSPPSRIFTPTQATDDSAAA